MSDEFIHYGTPRHSGRYPWGSGETPYQRAADFIGVAADLRKQGVSEKDIAAHFEMNTTELRARMADAKGYKKSEDIARVRILSEKGMSSKAISDRTGIPETTVRSLLKPDAERKVSKIQATKDALKAEVERVKYLDIGKGAEVVLGASNMQMNTAVQILKDEGYTVRQVYIPQVNNPAGNYTPTKVLCPPGVTPAELHANRGLIRSPGVAVDLDTGIRGSIKPPRSLDPRRMSIRYDEQGGSNMDGIIELRRGVPDLDLGAAHYAQVRIKVGKNHYLKGVAIYADDLPDGIDVRFNTNKRQGTKPLGKGDDTVLKELKDTGDPTNPFGTTIKRQVTYKDRSGKTQLSPLNIVNEEGDWDRWSRTLASQMLSKQRVPEASKQLRITRQRLDDEYQEIMSLTNPVIKRKLLLAHAESCESKAVSLKAAAYPGQVSQVILPVTRLKPNEIYAPNFRNGDRVALIRYPHGGTFEIPELVVNNKNAQAIRTIGKTARDAVGIHPSVAERLSGADFDGDTVVVIPNNDGKVRTSPPLKGLEGFDPKKQYAYREGMKVLKKGSATQREMGAISNLITDMTIKGASSAEIARAVRHSMVVIDAAKHKLDYKQSEADHGIKALKERYQREGRTDGRGGASTIISRAKSDKRVDEIRLRKASEGGSIDPKTGELVYIRTGGTHKKDYKDPNSPDVPNLTKMPAMRLAKDAHELVSPGKYPIEVVYADHANSLKAMARRARKSQISLEDIKYSPQARETYKQEYESLRVKIKRAHSKKPMERQAQLLAGAHLKMVLEEHPGMDSEDIKKVRRHALTQARASLGIQKEPVVISDREWKAIQAGAIRKNMMEELVEVASTDHLKELAMPKATTSLTASQQARAKRLLKSHTQAEVAESLGVSVAAIRALADGGED